jgi:calcineurin-like phosphoesterase family protein
MMGSNIAQRVAHVRAALNGGITLILGNHDRGRGIYKNAGFNDVQREWVGRLPPQGGPLIYMRHHPPERPEAKHAEYDLMLCGHVHTKWKNKGKLVNVGVDQWGYAPVALSTLVDRYALKRR